MRRLDIGVLIGLVALTVGCGSEPEMSEMAGECDAAWEGEVCTWTVMEGDALLEVGVTVPLASIESAPAEAPFVWPPATEANPAFPAGAGGFTHMTVNWEPVGHPPQTFLVPHFDFHFYMITDAERMAIDCSDPVKATELPEGYEMPDEQLPPELAAITGVDVLIGSCVPEMGMHAVSNADAMATEAFGGSMIVGYRDGTPIFLEPMISQALLLERRSFELVVPEVPGTEGAPTSFRAEYVPESDAYRLVFSGFSSGD